MRLNTSIQIDATARGGLVYNFDFVVDAEVTSTWENLTDTVRLKLPRRLAYQGQDIVAGSDALFRRGDGLKITSGYDGRLDTLFQGYVSDILPGLPIEIMGEDSMWLLKQTAIKGYSKDVSAGLTLKKLLTDILPAGTKFQAVDVVLGWFKIPAGTSVAQVLDHLKSHYGLTSFIRDGVLYSGLAYTTSIPTELKIVEITMDGSEGWVIDSSNLIYKRDDDTKITLQAVSIDAQNNRISTTVGDPYGEQRTVYFYGLSPAALEKYALETLPKMKYTGWRGDFTTFLQPQIKHGNAVRLISPSVPDRNGLYLVKKVVTYTGINGGRQTVELDRRIGN